MDSDVVVGCCSVCNYLAAADVVLSIGAVGLMMPPSGWLSCLIAVAFVIIWLPRMLWCLVLDLAADSIFKMFHLLLCR